uniref:COMM domain-containing protein 6 n=2 Tax=Equus TaxID=9789 RepID=F6YTA7_HORSE
VSGRPALSSAGLGWARGGRQHLAHLPPPAAAGRCRREPSPPLPQVQGLCPRACDFPPATLHCSFHFAPQMLIDFQWKLGMAVSSDSCRSLKYPYVAVMLKVADHSGQVKNKSFEMTIPQFQNFYRQFKEIAAIIETV